MPILIALAGIIFTAYIWANRARNAKHIASDIADMAGDVKAAARRFGFSRKMNAHPVESIDEPNIAAAAIADAYMSLVDMPTREQRATMQNTLADVLQVDAAAAEELLVLGRWMVNSCGTPHAALSRLAKKLHRLEGAQALAPMEQILAGITPDADKISVHQEEALHELRTALRVR